MNRQSITGQIGIRDGWNHYLAWQLETFPIYVRSSRPGHVWTLPYHRQPGIEINITHTGRAHLSVNRRGYSQSDRQIAAFSGTCAHALSVDRRLPYYRTVVCIEESLLQALLAAKGVAVPADVLDAIRKDYYGFSLSSQQWSAVEKLTADLVRTFWQREPWWQHVVAAQTAELIAALFVGVDGPSTPESRRDDWLEQCRQYVAKNLDKDLSLHDVARRFYVRPEHLTRSFTRAYGVSFMGYVQRERIRLACKLLAETAWPVAEIAEEAGFGSRTHFHRAFKRAMGITPTAYRDEIRRAEGE